MVDVCLVLEGTYPYVMGGVSGWVHRLISSLPNIRFSLLCVLPSSSTYQSAKYPIPQNVEQISEVYIQDTDLSRRSGGGLKADALDALVTFYRQAQKQDFSSFDRFYELVCNPETRGISPHELLNTHTGWELLRQLYDAVGDNTSFIDFYWSWRYAHLPLLNLCDAHIPKAHIYHPISTGYAGLVSVFAKQRYKRPLILTEHGIYTNERRIEIEQSEWFYEQQDHSRAVRRSAGALKRIWTQKFELLSALTYRNCDDILTIFSGNRKMQIAEGAPIEKTRVIHNGISIERFIGLSSRPSQPDTFQVGMVGRVVSIKDIKTYTCM